MLRDQFHLPQVVKAKLERRYTVIAAISNSADLNMKLPLWFCFKNQLHPGRLSKPQQEALNKHRVGARIVTTSSGMTTGEAWVKILTQLAYLIQKHVGKERRVLITYDLARSHGRLAAD